MLIMSETLKVNVPFEEVAAAPVKPLLGPPAGRAPEWMMNFLGVFGARLHACLSIPVWRACLSRCDTCGRPARSVSPFEPVQRASAVFHIYLNILAFKTWLWQTAASLLQTDVSWQREGALTSPSSQLNPSLPGVRSDKEPGSERHGAIVALPDDWLRVESGGRAEMKQLYQYGNNQRQKDSWGPVMACQQPIKGLLQQTDRSERKTIEGSTFLPL